jgi:hypothetical protein
VEAVARLERKIMKAATPVQLPKPDNFRRRGELPKQVAEPEVIEEVSTEHNRKTNEFTTLEVTSSKGKKLRIVTPTCYAKSIPKVWEWTKQRYEAADMVAEGFPVAQVADQLGLGSRTTIYAWLEHPEFREHVDALISETSYASQRERVAGLSRLTKMLFDKLAREIDQVHLTDKSMGAVISGIQGGLKQLAQEKGEFIEQQSIQQNTTLSGTLGIAKLDMEDLLKSKSAEERAALEAEFDTMGNEFIQNITGAKE